MMNATFVELPAFGKYREDYLNDDSYKEFQQLLIENPRAGDVIENTGGLRKYDLQTKDGKKASVEASASFITGGTANLNFGFLRCTIKMK